MEYGLILEQCQIFKSLETNPSDIFADTGVNELETIHKLYFEFY